MRINRAVRPTKRRTVVVVVVEFDPVTSFGARVYPADTWRSARAPCPTGRRRVPYAVRREPAYKNRSIFTEPKGSADPL